jgi:hypothetical protein
MEPCCLVFADSFQTTQSVETDRVHRVGTADGRYQADSIDECRGSRKGFIGLLLGELYWPVCPAEVIKYQ